MHTGKKCTRCKEFKELTDFPKNRSKKDGLHDSCKKCHKEYNIKRHHEHKKRLNELRSNRAFKNRKSENIRSLRWAKLNRGKVNFQTVCFKLKNKGHMPKWLTKEQKMEIKDLYIQAEELGKIFFNRKFHVDHIIPLQGKDVCGLHVPWNLQILTETENKKKGNK